ncbi:sulfatase-like hydrolase/transferase [Pontibacter sp. G13]|uniref:sulfatase family protein n=1 Tax=Pontibacter sp. G13 TaxID=3074898 RepID=UPI00288B7B4F|nr:sulfatase-like hydrolase/transferase [Pontibacter sp. G13]WNJ19066.1 sulfatase-like hydrolase/transferase [Pontibacter sp. G13]
MTQMKYSIGLLMLLAALGIGISAVSPSDSEPKDERPNIIIFMADDMGYADVGFTGAQDIQTPNLDQLAANGVVFRQGYVNHAFCGPSRAALLSGRYPYRFGFETNPAYDPANPHLGISVDETLFPARLQTAGYTTGAVGKWHLGAASEFHPLNRGFDYFYGFLGGGHDYFKIDLKQEVWEAYKQGLERNGRPAGFDGYLTTALSQDAAQFVKDNKDDPFFLYVAYNAPHQPLQAPKEDIARYAHIEDKKRRTYAAMIDVMDRGIGEVVQALKEQGIYDNTLIFFLSDNGGPQPNPKTGKGGNASSNEPFRGGKGNFYDGGVHVPFLAHWPAKFKPMVYDFPVHSLDIGRTAVELAGGDPTSAHAMEGVNLVPFVTGKKSQAPHEGIFWRGGNGKQWSILASDGTKHLKDKDSKEPQLFFLPEDVSEAHDRMADHPKRAKKLRAQWEDWDEQNIPNTLMGYKEYHRQRALFYQQAIMGQEER